MNIKEYRYDGSSRLNLKEAPTCAEPSAKKKDCAARTEANLSQCAILQEKLYAAGLEASSLPFRRGMLPVRTASSRRSLAS